MKRVKQVRDNKFKINESGRPNYKNKEVNIGSIGVKESNKIKKSLVNREINCERNDIREGNLIVSNEDLYLDKLFAENRVDVTNKSIKAQPKNKESIRGFISSRLDVEVKNNNIEDECMYLEKLFTEVIEAPQKGHRMPKKEFINAGPSHTFKVKMWSRDIKLNCRDAGEVECVPSTVEVNQVLPNGGKPKKVLCERFKNNFKNKKQEFIKKFSGFCIKDNIEFDALKQGVIK